MILVDTGPLVALFDLTDAQHESCRGILRGIREQMLTTIPVITEAFYMLEPESAASDGLRDFISREALTIWFLNQAALTRAFELMETYADLPMDFAEASLIAAAESLGTNKIFTIDRNHFETYRVRRGHRHYPIEVLT